MQSLMHVPYVVCHMPHVEAFDHNMCLLEVDHLLKWTICTMGSKDYCLSIVFPQSKIAVLHWSDPKSYNEPFLLIVFPGFWI